MRPNRLIMDNVGPFVGRNIIDFDTLDDIFLITGKTGAGKTTVFDALCYALYGALPGSRKTTVTRLRSDFAVEEAECSVSLEFSLGAMRYRVDRSPRQEKLKKRGTGTTIVDETAVLYTWSADRWESCSSRKSEADDKIQEILGLSVDEFSKIVLLPQGEFAEFLRQNTTKRSEVLRKLFPVELAVRVRELAQSKATELKSRLMEAERALAEAARKYHPEEGEKRLAEAEKLLEEAKKRTVTAASAMAAVEAALRDAESEEVLVHRVAEAVKAEKELEKQSREEAQWEEALGASRRGRPLADTILRTEEARKAAVMAREAATETNEGAKKAEETLISFLDGEKDILEQEREIQELRDQRYPLAKAASEEERIEEEDAELAALSERLEALKIELKTLDEETATREKELVKLQEQLDGRAELETRWEKARSTLERLNILSQGVGSALPLVKEHEITKHRIQQLQSLSVDLQKRIPILEAELAGVLAQKSETEAGRSAAILAATLKPGLPCPVCGSLDHPIPAAALAPVFGLDERSEALTKAKEDANRSLTEAKADLKSLEREQERIEGELRKARTLYAQERSQLGSWIQDQLGIVLGEELPTQEELLKLRQACSTETTLANKLWTEAQRAGNKTTELYRELEGFSKRRGVLSAEAAGVEERIANTETIHSEKLQRLTALRSQWHTETVVFALNRLDVRIQELQRRVEEYRKDRDAAARELALAQGRASTAEEHATNAETTLQESETILENALAASPFENEDELRTTLLSPEEEEELELRINRWKDEWSSLKATRLEAERNLGKLRAERAASSSSLSAGELREELKGLEGKKREAEGERDHAGAALAALGRDREGYNDAAERRRTLAEETSSLTTLADDLSGRNPKKRAFDSWLLGLYLQEVASYASKRLERMSEGRYSLILDTERAGGNAYTGLDLAVFDSYTGKARPCATLSGGESFMASISLALGLADSIQSRSGGIRLDAVFIDEGFGSLDEASLDRALGILDEIRDHRMVGLISHVPELRSRIPSRVDVLKGTTGSSIQMETFASG